jgi:hypothetical protein
MYSSNGSYWVEERSYPAPYGVPHIIYNTVALGGYSSVLPNGLAALPWQSPGL